MPITPGHPDKKFGLLAKSNQEKCAWLLSIGKLAGSNDLHYEKGVPWLLSKASREQALALFSKDKNLIKLRRNIDNKTGQRRKSQETAQVDITNSIMRMYTPSGKERIIALHEGGAKALGEGAFGRLKLVQDIISGEFFALKVQAKASDELIVDNEVMLSEEVGLLVGGNDREQSGVDKHYLLLELIPAQSLQEFLKSRKDISYEDALKIAVNICQAGIYINKDLNLVHRDHKAQNILIDPKTLEVEIIDFALSRKLNKDGVAIAPLEGTLENIPIETLQEALKSDGQNFAEVSASTDAFAIGKVLQKVFNKVSDTKIHSKEIQQVLNTTNHYKDNRTSLDSAVKILQNCQTKNQLQKMQSGLINNEQTINTRARSGSASNMIRNRSSSNPMRRP